MIDTMPRVVGMDGRTRAERAGKVPAVRMPIHPKAMEALRSAIANADADALKGVLHTGNKGLRAEFAEQSGWALPKTVGGTNEALEAFAAMLRANGDAEETAARELLTNAVRKHDIRTVR